MQYHQYWQGVRIINGIAGKHFIANVPGNIQLDYAKSMGFGDAMFGENCRQFAELENDTWEYHTYLVYEKNPGERVWFVTHGIDYQYDILLNSSVIYSGEGMFEKIELDLSDLLTGKDELVVRIFPHPKREGAFPNTRDEADASCKPPVCYGWDWNPRLLISGMWQDAYIETRNENFIGDCEATYKLSADFSAAHLSFIINCRKTCRIEFYDAEENLLYSGENPNFEIKNPKLWWCQGQGEPYLYHWKITNGEQTVCGKVGFRRVRLLRNIGANDPHGFPKSRYAAPITLELNGRRIFMKGSNWVNPELFWGTITKETYEPLLKLAKEANMNMLRLWGGAGFCKSEFYDLCDEMGLMVWQEFMLACNAYPNEDNYLGVLEREATFMIKKLRGHACLALWCGGNELFNGWSGMTDQSLPLRLLDRLCYDLDRDHPFLKTSPLEGMGHGGYMFYDERYGKDAFQCFQTADCTAYTEFGVPSISEMDALRQIIPQEELGEIRETQSWKLHHAVKAWMSQSHACLDVLKKYFGENATTEERVQQSDWLQTEGLKSIFEEARRQWPHCSAALNWCYNEPWITAANCSIVRYPAIPKPGYFGVKDALRNALFSARIPKFDWKSGEKFEAEIWLLNDAPEQVSASVKVFLKIGEQKLLLLNWENANVDANKNLQGAKVCCVLPEEETEKMTLVLESDNAGLSSEYVLSYKRVRKMNLPKAMNM